MKNWSIFSHPTRGDIEYVSGFVDNVHELSDAGLAINFRENISADIAREIVTRGGLFGDTRWSALAKSFLERGEEYMEWRKMTGYHQGAAE